eukprot:gnl/MRDRNA2_/MRDRNA2_51822_c0_seq1.p1 gnl/MRDRNA2_/MRDRNA2_51822_c0~~gnl/MRDRNA2_/MRDRNA2_51822_c0_seq1.p1  ORF type:complete len:791 (+),score=201.67 gnl/MRDRNA2_/MRDRNA2_51822_c0_seq1:105-2477(+)
MELQGKLADAVNAQGIFAEVIEPHSATADGAQLQLVLGEVIQIVERDTSGWWGGMKSSGQRGWFPASAVQELHPNDPRLRKSPTPKAALAPNSTADTASAKTVPINEDASSQRIAPGLQHAHRHKSQQEQQHPQRQQHPQQQHVQAPKQQSYQEEGEQQHQQQNEQRHQQQEEEQQHFTEVESSPGRQYAAEAAAAEANKAAAVQPQGNPPMPAPGADGHLPSKSSMIETPKKAGSVCPNSGPCGAPATPNQEQAMDCIESAAQVARQLAAAQADLSRAREERQEASTERREALDALAEARGWASRAELEAVTAEQQVDRAEHATAQANAEFGVARSELQSAQKEASILRRERNTLLEELAESRSRCELLERYVASRRLPGQRGGVATEPEEVVDRRNTGRSARAATPRSQTVDVAFDSTEVSLQRVESERQALLQRLQKEEQRFAQAQKVNQRLVNEKSSAIVRGAPTPSRTGGGRSGLGHVARPSAGYDIGARATAQRSGGRTPPPQGNRTPPPNRTPLVPGNRTPPAPGSPMSSRRVAGSATLSPRSAGGYPSTRSLEKGADMRIKSPRRQVVSNGYSAVESSPRRTPRSQNPGDPHSRDQRSPNLVSMSVHHQGHRDQPLAAFGADSEPMPPTRQASRIAEAAAEIYGTSGAAASGRGPLPPRPTAAPPQASTQARESEHLDETGDDAEEDGLIGTFVFGMSPLARTPSFADGGGSPVTPRSARSQESPMEPLHEESSILHQHTVIAMPAPQSYEGLDQEIISAQIAKVKERTSPRATDPRVAAGA